MPIAVYEENMRSLRAKVPHLAGIVDGLSRDPKISVVAHDEGAVSATYSSDNGNTILLHSKYDPVREAAKLVDGYRLSSTINVVMLGFGFGYHILDLIKRRNSRDFMVICERNPRIIKEAMEHVDLRPLFEMPNIFWFIDERPGRLNMVLKNKALSILANGVTVLFHPPSVQLHETYYAELKKAVEEFSVYARVNINTQIAKAEDFMRNAFLNLKEFIQARPVSDLFGRARGMPVFIVGAGPSLDKTVAYLREVRGRGYIIAVDSALATLLQQGIKPDFVVSIDFTKHTLNYFNNIDTRDLSLVFDLEICPDVLSGFKGRKYAIHLPKKSVSEWVTSVTGDKGAIEKGLSVSHSAALLATRMEASEIILVGQDLAYPRSQWHAKGSHFFQNLEITEQAEMHMCETEDIFGSPTKTSTSLMIFKNHFEMLIDQSAIPVYDATEGGAKISGARLISLKEAVIRFCDLLRQDLKEKESEYDAAAAFDIFCSAADKMLHALKEFTTQAATTSAKISQALHEFEINKDRTILRTSIVDVQAVIRLVNSDQGLLDLLKDNATEALLIRERKGSDSSFDVGTMSDTEIIFKLKKEQMFFMVLSRASALMAGEIERFLQKHGGCLTI
jgi:hypothetical protein